MNCEICKKIQATIHLTLIVEEHMRKVDLCESCAKTHGVNDPTGFSLAALLQQLEKRDNPNVE
jgi:protein arginine kinase activator